MLSNGCEKSFGPHALEMCACCVVPAPQQVLLIEGAVPPDTRLQGFDTAAELFLPAAKRPLVCESWVLAVMPHEERERFMEQRLFAAVAQLQPLATWPLMHNLAAELDLQQCMVLRMYYASAKGGIEHCALAAC